MKEYLKKCFVFLGVYVTMIILCGMVKLIPSPFSTINISEMVLVTIVSYVTYLKLIKE